MFDFERYMDSEIVQMVVNPEQQACGGGSSDENEDAVYTGSRKSFYWAVNSADRWTAERFRAAQFYIWARNNEYLNAAG